MIARLNPLLAALVAPHGGVHLRLGEQDQIISLPLGFSIRLFLSQPRLAPSQDEILRSPFPGSRFLPCDLPDRRSHVIQLFQHFGRLERIIHSRHGSWKKVVQCR